MKTWQLGNHTLEFIEETHTYVCDGLIVPSVSAILKSKYDDYVGVSKEVLNRAAQLGSQLHLEIELLEKEGKESDLREVKNYLFLKKHYKIENLENEIPIIYEKDGEVIYAGTLDQLCRVDGKLCINDFKRVSAPNKEKIACQLNLYKLGYENTYKEKIEMLSFMHLRDNTRKFYKLPVNEEYANSIIEEYLTKKKLDEYIKENMEVDKDGE